MTMIPDNLIIKYFIAGPVRAVYEIDEDGFKHGIYFDWHDNGMLFEISSYVHGRREGTYIDKYDNGLIWEITEFVRGVPHGISYYWYETGGIKEIVTYCNGSKSGLARSWHQNGVVDETCYYADDIEITEEIKSIVDDIDCMSDIERTRIALEFGIII